MYHEEAALDKRENARKGYQHGIKNLAFMRYEQYPANRGPDREVDGLMMTCPERLVEL